LTEFGEQLIANYRAIEESAQRVATAHLHDLEASLRPRARSVEPRRKTSIKARTS
jgi:molybdenum-dependent DNA-binding transcriptional regulator ModE